MKKTINTIILISIIFMSIYIIFAQDQSATAIVGGSMDVSVNDKLDYGAVNPGSSSDANSTITIGPNNNVDLNTQIKVTNPGTGNLFYHIIFDINQNGIFDESEIGSSTLVALINNVIGAHVIPTRLQVPTSFSKGPNNGIISYTFMEKDSSTYYYHPELVGLNQSDCLDTSNKVCISRDLSGPPYNIGTENISWGCGKCSNSSITWYNQLDTSFKNGCVSGNMVNIVGKDLCLRTQTLGDYSVIFSWFQSAGGGGFAYTRSKA
jgi:hypothetical protein